MHAEGDGSRHGPERAAKPTESATTHDLLYVSPGQTRPPLAYPTVVVAAETSAASAEGEAEGEIEADETPDVEPLSGVERGSGDILLGVLPGLSRLPAPFDEMFAGALSKPPNTLVPAGILVPLALPFLLVVVLSRGRARRTKSRSCASCSKTYPTTMPPPPLPAADGTTSTKARPHTNSSRPTS